MENKRIPITAAKKIAHDYQYPEVIIFAYDPNTGKQHVTTYGMNKEYCKDAALAASFLKKALGWPDDKI